MGMDFVVLLKYGGPDDRVLRVLDWLEVTSPAEVRTARRLIRAHGYHDHADEPAAWVSHRKPELRDPRLDRRPQLPNRDVALRLPEDFFLTFGRDAVEVYHLLRWRAFLTEPDLQQAMLAACSRLAGLLGATDCIITSDFSPVVHAFREGQGFDASLAAAGPDHGERPDLADLYQEIAEDYILRFVERPGNGGQTEYRDWDRDKPLPPGWERASTWDSKGYWRLPLEGGLQALPGEYASAPPTKGPSPVRLMDESAWTRSQDLQARVASLSCAS